MIKSVLFREDSVYKAFPDLVECGDGTWVCIYRESLGHTALPFGRIACHLSHDGGRTWSGKGIVDEVTDPETEGRLNNPRLLALDGSELLIICDLLPRLEPEEHPDSEIFIYRSTDSGRTWSGRASTGIRGHICPCIFRTRDGGIVIGGDRVGARDDPDAVWIHNAFTSTDGGRTWGPAVHVCSDPELWLNEGTYVELDDGTLVCYLREDLKRAIGHKAISKDGGRTWSGPFPTFLTCCVGRPRAGILSSGEVAVVHGFQRLTPPRNLVLHVETQEIAADPDCTANRARQSGHRYFFIDHDRSIHCDGAYSDGCSDRPGTCSSCSTSTTTARTPTSAATRSAVPTGSSAPRGTCCSSRRAGRVTPTGPPRRAGSCMERGDDLGAVQGLVAAAAASPPLLSLYARLPARAAGRAVPGSANHWIYPIPQDSTALAGDPVELPAGPGLKGSRRHVCAVRKEGG